MRDHVDENDHDRRQTDDDDDQNENEDPFENGEITLVGRLASLIHVSRATRVANDLRVDGEDDRERIVEQHGHGYDETADILKGDPAVVLERKVLEVIEQKIRQKEEKRQNPLEADGNETGAERLQASVSVENDPEQAKDGLKNERMVQRAEGHVGEVRAHAAPVSTEEIRWIEIATESVTVHEKHHAAD